MIVCTFVCVCVWVKWDPCTSPDTSLPTAVKWTLSHKSGFWPKERWQQAKLESSWRWPVQKVDRWGVELKRGSRARVEGRADQFCCLILHRLWINVYFKMSFFSLCANIDIFHVDSWLLWIETWFYPTSWTCYSCSGFPVLLQPG